MLKLREGIKILVSVEPIDARKSIDGLSCLIPDKFCDNPQSGNVFIFFNKARDKVKILYWDHNGFILHYKRLEKHHFVIPKVSDAGHLEITESQLYGLLAGLDFLLMRQFNDIQYYQYA
jgi:transposase